MSISLLVGVFNASPDEVENAQEAMVADLDKSITDGEALARYIAASGGNPDTANIDKWKEDRETDSNELDTTKGNRQTREVVAFIVAAFCFLCSLICFGINRGGSR